MSAAPRESDPGIYKVDTIPPPDGEASAYDAATKVGPMARAAIEKMFAEADVQGQRAAAATAPPTSGVRDRVEVAPQIPAPARIPILYDEADAEEGGDSLFDPTGVLDMARVDANAKKPDVEAEALARALTSASAAQAAPPPTVPVLAPTFVPDVQPQTRPPMAYPFLAPTKPPLAIVVAGALAALLALGLITNAIVGALTH